MIGSTMRVPSLLQRFGRVTPTASTATTAAASNNSSRSHYSYASPGSYDPKALEKLWKERDFNRRGFTVGIGGPVGSGKTALVLHLCQTLHNTPYNTSSTSTTTTDTSLQLSVVTNDIFTQEDANFLIRNQALPQPNIRAVETGGCPHAAIREDVSANLSALEDLTKQHYNSKSKSNADPLLLLCESGGDNLAAQFSNELADVTIYVIDVSGGEKVPRKGGPGITQSDLLVINKIDLAPAVGADLGVMERDARRMRGEEGETVFASVKHKTGTMEIQEFILRKFERAMALSTGSERRG